MEETGNILESLGDIQADMHNRPTCLLCARKHIAKARAKIVEGPLGYARHAWFAVGEMAEAEDELFMLYPEVAASIREARVNLMASLDPATEVDPERGLTLDPALLFPVDWDGILDTLTLLAAIERAEDQAGTTEPAAYDSPKGTEL